MTVYPGFTNWRKEALDRLLPPVRIHLDLCVGNSNWAHEIPSELMIGVDLNIERLRNHASRYLPLFMDARTVPVHFLPGTVDLVTFFDAIEHLPKRDGLDLLAAVERIATRQIMLFVPVESWDDRETPSRLARWEAGTYGIHLSRWEPDEMRDLGYEVLFNPTYHRRPDRTFGAMFCWKTLTQADAL